MDRSATHDFLLVIHSNHGPISYRFRHKRRLLSKMANFPTPMYLTQQRRDYSPWNFVTAVALERTNLILLPDGGKNLTLCAFVSVQYQRVTDRRTDGLICHNSIALRMHRDACRRAIKRETRGRFLRYIVFPSVFLRYELTEQKRNLATAASVDVLFFLMAKLLVIA